MEILKWLHTILGGSSPITGYLGSIAMVLSGAQLVTAMLQEQGIPKNTTEWVIFISGMASRFAKDANQSHTAGAAGTSGTVPVEGSQKVG